MIEISQNGCGSNCIILKGYSKSPLQVTWKIIFMYHFLPPHFLSTQARWKLKGAPQVASATTACRVANGWDMVLSESDFESWGPCADSATK